MLDGLLSCIPLTHLDGLALTGDDAPHRIIEVGVVCPHASVRQLLRVPPVVRCEVPVDTDAHSRISQEAHEAVLAVVPDIADVLVLHSTATSREHAAHGKLCNVRRLDGMYCTCPKRLSLSPPHWKVPA